MESLREIAEKNQIRAGVNLTDEDLERNFIEESVKEGAYYYNQIKENEEKIETEKRQREIELYCRKSLITPKVLKGKFENKFDELINKSRKVKAGEKEYLMQAYDIRDLGLAPSGHQKICWVKENMPLLSEFEEEFKSENYINISEVIWSESSLRWDVPTEKGDKHGLPLNWGGCESLEIIGNIHENSELLC